MNRLRFLMVGGFLGAGKTTALARLARFYLKRGQKVGLVTNDQAQDLVDTNSLRAQGFPVEEVAGACFCCRFDDLVSKVERLSASDRPDVILAEPVGSCTDLVATVVQPLKDLCGERFQVAPYAVLFKPSHGLRILRNEAEAGFSPKAAYIFRKQLEEADAILINRMDELSPAAREELTTLVAEQYPGVPVLRVSAKTGEGFEALTELLDQDGNFGHTVLDIDYDVYAAGEAELGWLNSTVHVSAAEPFTLDELLLDVLRRLHAILNPLQAEIAHLKAIGLWEASFGVANLVSSRTQPELSLPSHGKVREADLIVNARVAIDPVVLEEQVRRALEAACLARQAHVEFRKTQSFRPGRPTPTHRYTSRTVGQPKRVLFVCVENANRSQMAEAFARLHGGDRVMAFSAGSRPSGRVNPLAVESMKEVGYDLSRHQSKSLEQLPPELFDVVVTMGCGDACPLVRAHKRVDWNIPDPRALPSDQFRTVRDSIESKVKELLLAL